MKKFCQSNNFIIWNKAGSLFDAKHRKVAEFISGKLQLLAEISGEQRKLFAVCKIISAGDFDLMI